MKMSHRSEKISLLLALQALLLGITPAQQPFESYAKGTDTTLFLTKRMNHGNSDFYKFYSGFAYAADCKKGIHSDTVRFAALIEFNRLSGSSSFKILWTNLDSNDWIIFRTVDTKLSSLLDNDDYLGYESYSFFIFIEFANRCIYEERKKYNWGEDP